MFSYAERRKIAEHAYQATRKQLSEQRQVLIPKFAKHGVTINFEALSDNTRHLVTNKPSARAGKTGRALQQLEHVLDDLQASLPV